MARNGTQSKRIEAYFRANPNKAVSVAKLSAETRIGDAQAISKAISYLNRKARDGKGGLAIETLTRGKVWGYYPPEEKGMPDRMPNTVAGKAVPVGTPPVDQGVTSQQFKEGVVRMVAKLGEMEYHDQSGERVELLTLRVIGTSTDGYLLGLNEESGNVFRVVPV